MSRLLTIRQCKRVRHSLLRVLASLMISNNSHAPTPNLTTTNIQGFMKVPVLTTKRMLQEFLATNAIHPLVAGKSALWIRLVHVPADCAFRYRKGNLKRHVRVFHSQELSTAGKTCRICQKLFQRPDATRKHEWDKHKVLSAKPKKREKS